VTADEVVDSFFTRLSSRDWVALGEVLTADVERVGPFGDRLTGRERYLDFLAGAVPEAYGNDVHGVVSSADGRTACARVTEHLVYPDRALDLEETYWFHLNADGAADRVEIFWQTPESDPAGFGSAGSEESYAGAGELEDAAKIPATKRTATPTTSAGVTPPASSGTAPSGPASPRE
jgi:hypothetical protein